MSIYYASQVNEVAGWFPWSRVSMLSGRLSRHVCYSWLDSLMYLAQNDSAGTSWSSL